MKKRFLFVGFGLLLLSASPSVAQVAGFSEESGGIRKGQGQEVRIRGIRDSVVRIAPPCSGNIRQERQAEVLVPVKSGQEAVSRGDFKPQLCEMPVKAAPALMRKTDGGVPALASRREWTPSNPLAKSDSRLKSDEPVSVFMGTNLLTSAEDSRIVLFTVQDNEVREENRIQFPYHGYTNEEPDVQYSLFPRWGDWVGDGFVGMWGFNTSTTNYYTGYIWFDPMSGEAYSLKYHSLNNMLTSTSAAYDESSDLMYVVSYEYNYESETYDGFDLRSFAIVDDSICFRDSVRLSGLSYPLTLSIDQAGAMYIIAQDGNLYSVDKESGVASLVGSTGKQLETSNGGTYYQSATFDYYTGKLFWFYVEGSLRSDDDLGLVTVDLETAELTDIAESHSGERLSSQLGMMASVHYENPAPLAADYFYVTEYHDEGFLEFHWMCPGLNCNYEPLDSLEKVYFYQRLLRDEAYEYILLDSMSGIQPGEEYVFRYEKEEFSPEDTVYEIYFKDGDGLYSAGTSFVSKPVGGVDYYNGFENEDVGQMACLRFRDPNEEGLCVRTDERSYSGSYSYRMEGHYSTDSCFLDVSVLLEDTSMYQLSFYVSSVGEGSSVGVGLGGELQQIYAVSGEDFEWIAYTFEGAPSGLNIMPMGDAPIFIDELRIEKIDREGVPGDVDMKFAKRALDDRMKLLLGMALPTKDLDGKEIKGAITGLRILAHKGHHTSGEQELDTIDVPGCWRPGTEIEIELPLKSEGWWVAVIFPVNKQGQSSLNYGAGATAYIGPGIDIRGIVVDESGTPVQGVAVELLERAAQITTGDYFNLLSDTTDNDGFYCFNVAPADFMVSSDFQHQYTVNFRKMGWIDGMQIGPYQQDTVLDTVVVAYSVLPVSTVNAGFNEEIDMEISWNQPMLESWMGWMELFFFFYSGGLYRDVFKYAQRFTPEDMTKMGLVSPMVRDIVFYKASESAEYDLVLCQDETQEIFRTSVGNLAPAGFYIENLDEPVPFDPAKELWVVVDVKSGGSQGACPRTMAGARPGKGNLIYIDNQWQQLSDVFTNVSGAGNVMVGVRIVDSAAGMDPATGYRVYRGAEGAAFEEFSLLGEAIQDTFFIDKDFAGLEDGKYQYAVVAEWAKDSLSEAVYSEVVEKDSIVYPMPENLRITVKEFSATLSWQAAAGYSPSSYKVYLDGDLESDAVLATDYLFEELEVGAYKAGVIAVYPGGESEMATLEFEVEEPAKEYPMPENLQVSVDGLDATLSWEDPADVKPESYQIYLDDAQEASSVTGTQYVFENLEPGTYTAGVVAVYADGESEMATEEFEIKKTGNEDLWGGVSIYPNPTDGHFSIEVPFACRVELYSATGSCLLVKELPQEGLYPVNLDLAEGVYTLRLVSGKEYSVFKIVVR